MTDPVRPVAPREDESRASFCPTPDDLADPLFEIIWQGIKSHDVPNESRDLWSGATGNDVMMILRPLREHLAAAPVPRAASSADQWQPIDTAPKDGTQVWAWDDQRGSNPALFASDADAWLITYDDAVIHPTHWKPLPTPPRATGEGARDANESSAVRYARAVLNRAEGGEGARDEQFESRSPDGDGQQGQQVHAKDSAPVADAVAATALPRQREAGSEPADSHQPVAAPVAVSLDPHRLQTMEDAAEMLWIVLANVSGGDWTQQSQDWRDAAARWRDNYFDVLARLRGEATVRVEE